MPSRAASLTIPTGHEPLHDNEAFRAVRKSFEFISSARDAYTQDLSDDEPARTPRPGVIFSEESDNRPVLLEGYEYQSSDRPYKVRSNKERVEVVVPYFSRQWFLLLYTQHISGFLFLTLAGIVIGLLSQAIDVIAGYIREGHFFVTDKCEWWALRYFVWMAYLLLFLWFSALFVGLVAPAAIGPGLAEMKIVLSGCAMPKFLTFRTLIAKVVGHIAALGSGMSVGKLGPMGHIGPLVVNNMLRIPWIFQSIRENQSFRLLMLEAGVAMGISAHFGCPIGGLLFSVESTSTYYPVRNYWFSMYGSFWAALSSRMIFIVRKDLPIFSAMEFLDFDAKDVLKSLSVFEFSTALAIGVFCGILSAVFVQVHVWIVYVRRLLAKTGFPLFTSKYPYLFLVGILTATVFFPDLIGDFMPLGAGNILQDLTHDGPLSDQGLIAKDYSTPSIYINLPLLVAGRWIVTMMTASVAIPSGVFEAAWTSGAGIGRFTGELINKDMNRFSHLPGIYAFFGAAALSCGLTQTFSPVLILMEMTGQIFHLMPTLVASITAIAVARKLSYNIYDGILISRKLPYLPDLTHQATFALVAGDVMIPDALVSLKTAYVTPNIHYEDLVEKLEDKSYPYDEFAVVDEDPSDSTEEKTPVIRGVISRAQLHQVIIAHQKSKLKDDQEDSDSLARTLGTTLRGIVTGRALRSRKYTDEEKLLFLDYLTIPTDFNSVNVHPNMPIDLVHKLFIIFRLTSCFVTENGCIIGVITRERLRRTVQSKRRFYEYDPTLPIPK